ncbi:MAG: ABC transporter substrate-binding protein [Nocardioidaceae bacterium]
MALNLAVPSRRTFAAVFLGVLALLTASCSGGSTASGGRTEITFSYLWTGPEAKALEQIITDFNASQDEIRVRGVSNPDMQKQLASMSSSSGSFDISDNFGNSTGSWAAKGVLAPLDEYLEPSDTDDFIPAALDQMRYDGKLYSVPIAVHTFQLLYNKKLLDEAGVAPPTTTQELATAIEKLTKVDKGGNITQLGLGNPDLATSLITLAYAFGGTWDGADPSAPEATPAEPGNVDALAFWQDHITDKYGADKVAKFTAGWGQYMSPQDPFYTGKVAMTIDGEWQAVSIPKNASNLEWGVTAIPVADPAYAGATQLTASTLFIPANSKHKAEAATFLKYLVDDEAMLAFSKTLGNLPGRTSLLDDETYASIPNFSTWLESLKSEHVHALASAPYSAEYATDLGAAFDAVARGESSPDQALQSVAKKSDDYATD